MSILQKNALMSCTYASSLKSFAQMQMSEFVPIKGGKEDKFQLLHLKFVLLHLLK